MEMMEALEAVECRMHALVCAHADADVLREACLFHLQSGGKRTRAWLALSALEALGAPLSKGIDFAAACELLHNASLIHDDLEDGDRFRRGRPTVGARFGDAQALNAGDFMLLLPGLAVGQSPLPESVRVQLSVALAKSALATASGQSHDLALLENQGFQFEAYARAAGGKTAPFFSLPVFGAALIAGHNASQAAHLAEPFTRLGLVYQMCDDYADLYGDKGREKRGNDIAEGKISLLVVEHVKAWPNDRAHTLRILRKDRAHTTLENIDDLAGRFAASGARQNALARIRAAHDEVLAHAVLQRRDGLSRLGRALLQRILENTHIALDWAETPKEVQNAS
jgi:geranylgeranyl diphosphate synthase type I